MRTIATITAPTTTTTTTRVTRNAIVRGRVPPPQLRRQHRHDVLSSPCARWLSSTANIPTAVGPWIDRDGYFQNFTDNAFRSVAVMGEGTHGGGGGDAATTTKTAVAHVVRNPATQEIIGTVAETPDDVADEMMEKARIAYGEWKSVPVSQRQRVMFRLQHLIRERADDLAATITAENGKTLNDAAGDVFRGLEVVETACGAVSTHMQGQSLRGLGSTVDTTSYRRPLGVTAGICPFNFPAMIPLWMFPLAVTTGNAMLLKPSEKTPATACQLALMAAEAGLPPNVLQIVQGGRNTVSRLCNDATDTVRAVSFVGSNQAGEWIADTAYRNGIRVQANLGAKNHAVILPDAANPRAVTKALVGAAFGAGGQRCMAVSFFFFKEKITTVSSNVSHLCFLRIVYLVHIALRPDPRG